MEKIESKTENSVERNLLLLVPIIILVIALIPLNDLVLQRLPGAVTPAASTSNHISVMKTADGELIGLSYGADAFDLDGKVRKDIDNKLRAGNALRQGNFTEAQFRWSQATEEDPSDAEVLIYKENQRVLSSGSPYLTLVVGTTLTGDLTQGGRAILQGAYVAEKEHNDDVRKHGGQLLRLLIANAGSDEVNATKVAQQIVQAAWSDQSIVGVMGWNYSGATTNVIPVLAGAHIPIVSPTSSSDSLTNLSPYFFRIVPPDKAQVSLGVRYVEQKLKARRIALFEDPNDVYSKSLADAFGKSFTREQGNSIVAIEQYKRGQTNRLAGYIQDALDYNPDLIFFSGYWNDASTLLIDLAGLTARPRYQQFANLPIMGGDAMYDLVRYPANERPDFKRLHFTSFASPDTWHFLCNNGHPQACSSPDFFTEYAQAFDPDRKQPPNTYNYNLADAEAILAYDATMVFLNGYKNALAEHQHPSLDDLQQALTKITGPQALQGVSGQIAFGSDSNPIQKPVVVVDVNPSNDDVQLVSVDISDHFLKNQ